MKFRSRVTGQKRYRTENGRPFANEYAIEIDEHQHKTLQKVGETNAYAMIQSYAEECKIENIIARAQLGDESALNRREGQYLDTTTMPTTLAEAQNIIIKLTNEFEQLPVDVRAKFDHSPEKYIASFGSEEWLDTMGMKNTIETVNEVAETVEGGEVNE